MPAVTTSSSSGEEGATGRYRTHPGRGPLVPSSASSVAIMTGTAADPTQAITTPTSREEELDRLMCLALQRLHDKLRAHQPFFFEDDATVEPATISTSPHGTSVSPPSTERAEGKEKEEEEEYDEATSRARELQLLLDSETVITTSNNNNNNNNIISEWNEDSSSNPRAAERTGLNVEGIERRGGSSGSQGMDGTGTSAAASPCGSQTPLGSAAASGGGIVSLGSHHNNNKNNSHLLSPVVFATAVNVLDTAAILKSKRIGVEMLKLLRAAYYWIIRKDIEADFQQQEQQQKSQQAGGGTGKGGGKRPTSRPVSPRALLSRLTPPGPAAAPSATQQPKRPVSPRRRGGGGGSTFPSKPVASPPSTGLGAASPSPPPSPSTFFAAASAAATTTTGRPGVVLASVPPPPRSTPLVAAALASPVARLQLQWLDDVVQTLLVYTNEAAGLRLRITTHEPTLRLLCAVCRAMRDVELAEGGGDLLEPESVKNATPPAGEARQEQQRGSARSRSRSRSPPPSPIPPSQQCRTTAANRCTSTPIRRRGGSPPPPGSTATHCSPATAAGGERRKRVREEGRSVNTTAAEGAADCLLRPTTSPAQREEEARTSATGAAATDSSPFLPVSVAAVATGLHGPCRRCREVDPELAALMGLWRLCGLNVAGRLDEGLRETYLLEFLLDAALPPAVCSGRYEGLQSVLLDKKQRLVADVLASSARQVGGWLPPPEVVLGHKDVDSEEAAATAAAAAATASPVFALQCFSGLLRFANVSEPRLRVRLLDKLATEVLLVERLHLALFHVCYALHDGGGSGVTGLTSTGMTTTSTSTSGHPLQGEALQGGEWNRMGKDVVYPERPKRASGLSASSSSGSPSSTRLSSSLLFQFLPPTSLRGTISMCLDILQLLTLQDHSDNGLIDGGGGGLDASAAPPPVGVSTAHPTASTSPRSTSAGGGSRSVVGLLPLPPLQATAWVHRSPAALQGILDCLVWLLLLTSTCPPGAMMMSMYGRSADGVSSLGPAWMGEEGEEGEERSTVGTAASEPPSQGRDARATWRAGVGAVVAGLEESIASCLSQLAAFRPAVLSMVLHPVDAAFEGTLQLRPTPPLSFYARSAPSPAGAGGSQRGSTAGRSPSLLGSGAFSPTVATCSPCTGRAAGGPKEGSPAVAGGTGPALRGGSPTQPPPCSPSCVPPRPPPATAEAMAMTEWVGQEEEEGETLAFGPLEDAAPLLGLVMRLLAACSGREGEAVEMVRKPLQRWIDRLGDLLLAGPSRRCGCRRTHCMGAITTAAKEQQQEEGGDGGGGSYVEAAGERPVDGLEPKQEVTEEDDADSKDTVRGMTAGQTQHGPHGIDATRGGPTAAATTSAAVRRSVPFPCLGRPLTRHEVQQLSPYFTFVSQVLTLHYRLTDAAAVRASLRSTELLGGGSAAAGSPVAHPMTLERLGGGGLDCQRDELGYPSLVVSRDGPAVAAAPTSNWEQYEATPGTERFAASSAVPSAPTGFYWALLQPTRIVGWPPANRSLSSPRLPAPEKKRRRHKRKRRVERPQWSRVAVSAKPPPPPTPSTPLPPVAAMWPPRLIPIFFTGREEEEEEEGVEAQQGPVLFLLRPLFLKMALLCRVVVTAYAPPFRRGSCTAAAGATPLYYGQAATCLSLLRPLLEEGPEEQLHLLCRAAAAAGREEGGKGSPRSQTASSASASVDATSRPPRPNPTPTSPSAAAAHWPGGGGRGSAAVGETEMEGVDAAAQRGQEGRLCHGDTLCEQEEQDEGMCGEPIEQEGQCRSSSGGEQSYRSGTTTSTLSDTEGGDGEDNDGHTAPPGQQTVASIQAGLAEEEMLLPWRASTTSSPGWSPVKGRLATILRRSPSTSPPSGATPPPAPGCNERKPGEEEEEEVVVGCGEVPTPLQRETLFVSTSGSARRPGTKRWRERSCGSNNSSSNTEGRPDDDDEADHHHLSPPYDDLHVVQDAIIPTGEETHTPQRRRATATATADGDGDGDGGGGGPSSPSALLEDSPAALTQTRFAAISRWMFRMTPPPPPPPAS